VFIISLLFYVSGQKKSTATRFLKLKDSLTYAKNSGFDVSAFETKINTIEEEISSPYVYIFTTQYKRLQTEINLLESDLHNSYVLNVDAKKDLLSSKLKDMQLQLIIVDPYSIPSRDRIQQELDTITTSTSSADLTIMKIDEHLTRIKELGYEIDYEVEKSKIEQLIKQVNASFSELEELEKFYETRGGMQKEKTNIFLYREKASEILSSQYNRLNSDKLEIIIQQDLYPLLSLPRKTKAQIQEEEHRAWLEEQRRLQSLSGIPQAQIGTGKEVVIDLSQQRLFAYQDGVSIFSNPIPITSGKNGFETVKGQFAIYYKQTHFRMRSPFPNEYYDNFVTYWMPFFEGYGLHDAPWRSVYGTQDYPYVGSHGCVNVPFAEVERLYYWVDVGTPVTVK